MRHCRREFGPLTRPQHEGVSAEVWAFEVSGFRVEPEWTVELIDLLAAEMITTQDLRAAGVLASTEIPIVKDRPVPERPPRQGQL